jgi:hypothetical protein
LSSFFTKPISAVIAKHGMAERLWLDPTDFFYWLVVWNILFFPFSWECHHPNWRTPSFFTVIDQPPTSIINITCWTCCYHKWWISLSWMFKIY